MGFLDKMKSVGSAMTGGAARVSIEYNHSPVKPGDALPVKVTVVSMGKEVKPSGREVDLAFVRIETSVCTGCGLCVQPCAPNAIVHHVPVSPIQLVKGCGV